jgi:hypothetical protein
MDQHVALTITAPESAGKDARALFARLFLSAADMLKEFQ